MLPRLGSNHSPDASSPALAPKRIKLFQRPGRFHLTACLLRSRWDLTAFGSPLLVSRSPLNRQTHELQKFSEELLRHTIGVVQGPNSTPSWFRECSGPCQNRVHSFDNFCCSYRKAGRIQPVLVHRLRRSPDAVFILAPHGTLFRVPICSTNRKELSQQLGVFDRKAQVDSILFRYIGGAKKSNQEGIARLNVVVSQGRSQPAVSFESC